MINVFGWDDMKVDSTLGSYCVDKKVNAINWVESRGKSVIAEGITPSNIVSSDLKSDIKSMADVNITKNPTGSTGAIGVLISNASNIVPMLFITLGQDFAQNIESSNYIILL